jgi:hypothetical protein
MLSYLVHAELFLFSTPIGGGLAILLAPLEYDQTPQDVELTRQGRHARTCGPGRRGGRLPSAENRPGSAQVCSSRTTLQPFLSKMEQCHN